MPAVHLNLSQVLNGSVEGSFNPRVWVELTTSMRTLSAFEASLRRTQLAEWLIPEPFEFLREGGVVMATMCLVGDIVEVVAKELAGSSKVAEAEHKSESAGYAKNIDARQDSAYGSSGIAAQAGSAVAEPQDKSGGDAAQVGSAIAEPQNSGQARSWADIGAQRSGQPGTKPQSDHTHKCDNCGVTKPKVMYHPFMWAQKFHPYSVCIQCEAHLQCSGCDRVCGPSLSNPLSKRAAFSKTQARKWDGSRKCKDCVRTFAPQAAAQAASQAAAQVVAQDTGAAQAATQDTGAVQEAEAPITGASQNAAQDTDATQGTAASQAAAQVVAQDTAAVQEADATEDVVSSTGAADDAARPPNRWQAMDFEDIQDLRRRRDLAALAAEEGAALAADEEAEHSTDAAFSEGDGSSDDESVTESQDDEFVALLTRNCIVGNQLFNFTM